MGALRGRPPRPVEQKALVGRAPGRDSGGRKLPETVAVVGSTVLELPTAAPIPDVPHDLETAGRAGRCSYAESIGAGCDICLDELAVKAWRELWTAGREWLSMTRDRRVLIRLCLAYSEEAHLRAALLEDGPFVKGQRGGLVAHPAVLMLRILEREITKWEGLCGFNPSDGGRLGIKVGKERGKSPLEQLLENRTRARAERRAELGPEPAKRGRRASGTRTPD